MKFYKEDSANYFYWEKIKNNKLTVTYFSNNIWFFKNGKIHNAKNVAFIKSNGLKKFHLNGKSYGYEKDFTKESWRRFAKLHAFL